MTDTAMMTTAVSDDGAGERIERAALASFHAAAPRDAARRLDLRMEEMGGALVSAMAAPGIVINRTIGLGENAPADRATIAAIRSRYRTAGTPRAFVHVGPHARPSGLRDWLAAEGFTPARRWMKFERGMEPPPDAPTDLTVRRVGAEHGTAFGRIAAAAFDLPDDAVPVLAALTVQPGWHVFMTFAGEEPAGCGALFVDGDAGWFDWGATDPRFRGQGAQRAALAARVRHAIGLGCRRIYTCTGEAVPGDPQHSYHNIEWAGFRPAYPRENWAISLV